ncbi:hypothetical protein VP01_1652g2 [Puccinia sorghi]|uniref:Uncharacterized protein n=1 Tax=Puccinia sorghi TaxID=27349 RepID=A0A0L6VH27_9BASI|nr:hypothetical protein VP01_1652g2 [Puccinia sorghi]
MLGSVVNPQEVSAENLGGQLENTLDLSTLVYEHPSRQLSGQADHRFRAGEKSNMPTQLRIRASRIHYCGYLPHLSTYILTLWTLAGLQQNSDHVASAVITANVSLRDNRLPVQKPSIINKHIYFIQVSLEKNHPSFSTHVEYMRGCGIIVLKIEYIQFEVHRTCGKPNLVKIFNPRPETNQINHTRSPGKQEVPHSVISHFSCQQVLLLFYFSPHWLVPKTSLLLLSPLFFPPVFLQFLSINKPHIFPLIWRLVYHISSPFLSSPRVEHSDQDNLNKATPHLEALSTVWPGSFCKLQQIERASCFSQIKLLFPPWIHVQYTWTSRPETPKPISSNPFRMGLNYPGRIMISREPLRWIFACNPFIISHPQYLAYFQLILGYLINSISPFSEIVCLLFCQGKFSPQKYDYLPARLSEITCKPLLLRLDMQGALAPARKNPPLKMRRGLTCQGFPQLGGLSSASAPLYIPQLAIYHLNHNILLTLKLKILHPQIPSRSRSRLPSQPTCCRPPPSLPIQPVAAALLPSPPRIPFHPAADLLPFPPLVHPTSASR